MAAPRPKRDPGQTSSLATEFLVASQLMRQGFTVTLTLGQTKEIDLIAISPRGRRITIDAKGLKNKTNWPMRPKEARRDHFFVFVSYLGHYSDPRARPDFFIVPSTRIRQVIGSWSGRPEQRAVAYSRLKRSGFENAWHLLK